MKKTDIARAFPVLMFVVMLLICMAAASGCVQSNQNSYDEELAAMQTQIDELTARVEALQADNDVLKEMHGLGKYSEDATEDGEIVTPSDETTASTTSTTTASTTDEKDDDKKTTVKTTKATTKATTQATTQATTKATTQATTKATTKATTQATTKATTQATNPPSDDGFGSDVGM